MKLTKLSAAVLAAGMMFSAAAQAEGEAFTTAGSLAITSDYLYRGVSQSSNTAAIQGAMSLNHSSGFYATVWGSSIEGGVSPNGLELDPAIGYTGSAGDVTYDVGVLRYGYPGNSDRNPFTEVYGSVSMSGAKLGLAYSDDFFGETGESIYVYLSYGKEIAGLNFSAYAGVNMFDEIDVADGYVDYKVAVSKAVSGITFEAAYVGSDLSDDDCLAFSAIDDTLCEGRAVFTASKGF